MGKVAGSYLGGPPVFNLREPQRRQFGVELVRFQIAPPSLAQFGDVLGAPIKLIGPPAKPDTVIARRELPKGEGVILMIPDKQRPYRLSIRSPTLVNLSVLPTLCKGVKFADLFAILGSLDLVFGETDR